MTTKISWDGTGHPILAPENNKGQVCRYCKANSAAKSLKASLASFDPILSKDDLSIGQMIVPKTDVSNPADLLDTTIENRREEPPAGTPNR